MKPTYDSPASQGTHVTCFMDDEAEEKKVDDEMPLLSPGTAVSSGKPMLRRRGNSLLFRRKKTPSVINKKEQPTARLAQPESSASAKPGMSKKERKKSTEKSRFNLGDFGRRLSLQRRERQDNKEHDDSAKTDEREEEDDPQVMEQDPVIQIFESRNTQRVRFALEGNDENLSTSNSDEDPSAPLTDDGKASRANIKLFMSRALFGSSKSSKNLNEEMKAEVANLGGGSLVWESSAEMGTEPEVVHTEKSGCASAETSELRLSFTEDPLVRTKVEKLQEKARKAGHLHFRYEHGVKCYLKVLSLLKEARYPDDHPTVAKTIEMLNSAHHKLSSYNNSADIVKMGIKYEDAGELVRALKMYTIAYRIRRDNLSRNHPSLVVLLNMLGSIQIKRGELQEAMQIYELALMDSPVVFNKDSAIDASEKPPSNLLAKSVTYREMGVIYERWGQIDKALNTYHKSLECVTEWKEAVRRESRTAAERNSNPTFNDEYSIGDVRLTKAVSDKNGFIHEGQMEVFIGSQEEASLFGVTKNDQNMYEIFFPAEFDTKVDNDKPSSASPSTSDRKKTRQDAHADMDLALTLHQIAQLHRSQGEFTRALDAYIVALRGMKHALGKHHPNVAAVLGNIGNLQKEMGDIDAAYRTYEEVLGIESHLLGLSHPDVAITLHNIATIDAARGNYDHALELYRIVIGLEKKLFGDEHISVAVAAACMGDVYEKIGQYKMAVESYEEAMRIKSLCLGRHAVDVARLLHKLGKLAFLAEDYHMAESYVSRALLMYRLNKIDEEHPWMVDASRDSADISAALAMGQSRQFEC